MKYIEPNALNDVAKFHETFDLPIVETPAIPAEARCKLRIALLAEELKELEHALEQMDIVEAADALADLQYVLSGAVIELGLGAKFKSLFDEVQRSNMSKTCKSIDEAEATLSYYKEQKNTEGFIVEKNGEYLVYRASDKKVLKSINYSEANLKDIINS